VLWRVWGDLGRARPVYEHQVDAVDAKSAPDTVQSRRGSFLAHLERGNLARDEDLPAAFPGCMVQGLGLAV